jgi:hypothetical protein
MQKLAENADYCGVDADCDLKNGTPVKGPVTERNSVVESVFS